jgi:hypothetical protein
VTSRFARLLTVAVAPLALALPLTGCVTPAPSGPAAPASSAPAGTGTLDFATVEKITAPALQKDPNCVYGQWNENSTGVDEEFRSAVKFFRQFDCYKSKDDVGGLPERLRQSIFVEFNDDATATKFGESERTLYSNIVDGPRVVVTGTGLDSVDMKAYLEELKSACGCGEILESGT